MISLKKFVDAIHDAIVSANDKIKERNEDILEKYFEEASEIDDETGISTKTGVLNPKSVIVEFPFQNHDGVTEKTEISIPLITLDPLKSSQIEKATLKADFLLSIADDEIQLSFANGKKIPEGATKGMLEIIISPQETSDGLRQIVEGYEAALKGQISSS